MTVEGLAASVVWSAVVGYATWRADLRVATRERRLALDAAHRRDRMEATDAETKKAAALRRTASSVTLPDDLEAVALQESEEWARDNERQLMRERFVELHQLSPAESDDDIWQKVRRGVGIAEMP